MFNAMDYKQYENSIIVRYDELSLLSSILSEHKICVLQGAAGIGKTHLVMTYCRNCSHYQFVNYWEYGYEHNMEILDSITQDSVFVVDEIENVLELFESCFFKELKSHTLKNIILITRNLVTGLEYPVITLGGFNRTECFEYVRINSKRSYDNNEIEQMIRISCGNPVVLNIICSLSEDQSNFDEIWEMLSLRENKNVLFNFLDKVRHNEYPILSDAEYQTLLEILLFGKIDKTLLIRWDKRANEQVENSIDSLVCKGVISCESGNLLYGDYFVGDIFAEYPLCHDYSLDIMDSIKEEISQGIEIDEQYILPIIEALKTHYKFVDFIVAFFESKTKVAKGIEALSKKLTVLVDQVTHISYTIDGDVVPNVSRIPYLEDRIDKLLLYQKESIKLIEQLEDGYSTNQEALDHIEELIELVKNPNKSKWERVNSCIGFLGSVATLATFSEQGFSQNMNILTKNASEILSQLMSLLDKLPFIK